MTCTTTNKSLVKGLHLHQPSREITEKEPEPIHGISKKFKEIIEEFIYRNISKPYCIYQEILLNHFNDNWMPTLLQIQNYLKYRRQKHGEVNSIDGLVDHITPKLFNNVDFSTHETDLPIYFGAEINEGGEETHFHLGLTTSSLGKPH